jgi:hypothetical protein
MIYAAIRAVFHGPPADNLCLRVAQPLINMQTLIAEMIILCDIADTLGPTALLGKRARQRDGS